MVSLRYASMAQIAAELRRRVYGERAKLAGVIPKPTQRIDPQRLEAIAEKLQRFADEEDANGYCPRV